MNNVWSYNNAVYGIYSDDGTHKYYGSLTMFDNLVNIDQAAGSIGA
ncbi:hypothetical protein KKG31_00975 [Patescibacteria group bacterium]|nr:hypothetical protein [Patescibacteria group bacterium]